MADEIKMNPCSVCGAKAQLLMNKEFYATRCSNSDCPNSAYTTYDDRDAAVAGWNKENPA